MTDENEVIVWEEDKCGIKYKTQYPYKLDLDTVNTFISNIKYNLPLGNNKIFVAEFITLSQSKLRDAGYTIVRDMNKADFILISNIFHKNRRNEDKYDLNWDIIDYIDKLKDTHKFVFIDNIYKTLYKYQGDLELFNNIHSLLASNDRDNVKIAMEFMSNANWEGNEIYLIDIFNLHYKNTIRGHSYKTSVSFKGFLDSLTFNYRSLNYYEAYHYKELCHNQEHHQFVFDKFSDDFKNDLDLLMNRYKLKIDEIKYSIDMDLIDEDEELSDF